MSPEQEARRTAMWTRISRGELNAAATDARLLLESTPDPRVHAELHAALGLVLQRVGRIAESRDAFALAAALAAEQPGEQASYVADEAGSRFLLGDLAGAAQAADRARGLGEQHGNRFAACEALNTQAAIALSEGRPADALRLTKMGIALQAAERQSSGGGPLSHLYHGLALVELDRFADAEAAFGEGLLRSNAAGSTGQVAWYHAMRGLARYLNGRWDEAVVDGHLALDGARSAGTLIARPVAAAVVALVEALRGNVSTAQRHVRPVEGGLTVLGLPGEDWLSMARAAAAPEHRTGYTALTEGWLHTRRTPYFLSWRSLAPALVSQAVRYDDHELACAVTASAEAGAAAAPGIGSAQGAALRCRALLDADPEAARAAMAALREAGIPIALGLAWPDAALLLGARGHRHDAQAAVREAADAFSGLRATPWLARAGRALLRLPAEERPAADREPVGWAQLTSAEREVARRVAQGLTNPEIARELVVSPRTVQTHASHVYAKLGVSSRVQLTAVLHRHGLDR
ncbi:LuxR C-terminal-related transcriptional regulator [Nocardioides kongjuensis]|uniref:LuxR C-terminal-related transcriptional regulator n=1 Tax=Nocardioides kongjuensis TaxID=349522 RepID=UPI0035EA02B8